MRYITERTARSHDIAFQPLDHGLDDTDVSADIILDAHEQTQRNLVGRAARSDWELRNLRVSTFGRLWTYVPGVVVFWVILWILGV